MEILKILKDDGVLKEEPHKYFPDGGLVTLKGALEDAERILDKMIIDTAPELENVVKEG